MSFPPGFLDEIRARVPLAGIVGRKVKLARRGHEYTGLCPFHNEKTPSFTLNEDKGFYHCFGCGAHGDVIGFVMQTEGLSFPEAVERLAGEAGLEVPRPTPEARAAAERQATLLEALEAAASWFEQQLTAAAGAAARSYLEGRGLAAETISAFRLGFAPDRRGALRAALKLAGIDDRRLAEAGLIKIPEDGGEPRDYFFNRIVFPITDRRGRVIAFGGRALGDSPAKYLNSPDTPLFHKGRVLYNLARARQAARDADELIVVEGYMDAIALTAAGFPAVVAPLGTAVTAEQIGELWRLSDEPVLCLDGDAAGQRAGMRVAERALPLLRPGQSLRFATLPKGEDPDSLVRGAGPPAMRRVLQAARPLVALVWHLETVSGRFDTPERQAGLIRALDRRLREIGDADVQKAYREALNQRFFDVFGFGAWGRPARSAAERGRRGPRSRPSGSPFGLKGRRAGPGNQGFGHRGEGRERWVGGTAAAAHQAPDLLVRRQEQVLLAALVNHPELIVEYAEGLAEINFASDALDRLFQAALEIGAREPDLDSDAMKCHLTEKGFAAIFGEILHARVYVHGRFARPGGSLEEARTGILHILEGYRRRQAEEETDMAGRDLAAAMADGVESENALAKLEAKQRQLKESDERWFELDHPDGVDT
jgi:DNA primase